MLIRGLEKVINFIFKKQEFLKLCRIYYYRCTYKMMILIVNMRTIKLIKFAWDNKFDYLIKNKF